MNSEKLPEMAGVKENILNVGRVVVAEWIIRLVGISMNERRVYED